MQLILRFLNITTVPFLSESQCCGSCTRREANVPLAHRQAEPLLGRAGGSEMLVRMARGAEMKLHAIQEL